MILKFISHDVVNNTLEATWIRESLDGEGNIVGYVVAKSRNYSAEQKAELDAEIGTTKYSDMAGW